MHVYDRSATNHTEFLVSLLLGSILFCFFHQWDFSILSDLCKGVLFDKDSIFKYSLEKILSTRKKKVCFVTNYAMHYVRNKQTNKKPTGYLKVLARSLINKDLHVFSYPENCIQKDVVFRSHVTYFSCH